MTGRGQLRIGNVALLLVSGALTFLAPAPTSAPPTQHGRAISAIGQAAAAGPTAVAATHELEHPTQLHLRAHPRAIALRTVFGKPIGSGRALDAIDGRDDTAWVGAANASSWSYTALFERQAHVSLIRIRFGASTTQGIPVGYRWEFLRPAAQGCATDGSWLPIDEAASRETDDGSKTVAATRRSWFVDEEACGVRLLIDRTNAGAPVLRELEAIEGARNVLLQATASAPPEEGALAQLAIDGTYEHGFLGAPGRARWTLSIALPKPRVLDRVALTLGENATTVARKTVGRVYSIAHAPVHWTLEGSSDGVTFTKIGSTTHRAARRPLVRFSPRAIRVLRLVMEGATDARGLPDAEDGYPIVREVAAYAADDAHPILATPWVLSVNANPAASSHHRPGGELANDTYFAKFIQMRFASLMPTMKRDDRYARALGMHGELLDTVRGDADGMALESIEGDDETLDDDFLLANSPRPIVVLSGSNDWEFARRTDALETQSGKDAILKMRWNPLRDARHGGMGQLQSAVKGRVAPFLGLCGGAQILALLEAKSGDDDGGLDGHEIDLVLRRNTGRPIRGFPGKGALERAWPGEGHPRAKVSFLANDPLFLDISGPSHRTVTHAFPESHTDLVRPEAFLPGGALARFDVLATSLFCGKEVITPNHCSQVTEVFRARTGRFPLIGTQFHPEQRDFDSASNQDPPESVADGRLFMAAAYEEFVDAYVRNGD